MKAITCKYLGLSHTRRSRIKATEPDGRSVTVSYDHALNIDDNYKAAAKALCTKMGWTGRIVQGATKEGAVFVFAPIPMGLADYIFQYGHPRTPTEAMIRDAIDAYEGGAR